MSSGELFLGCDVGTQSTKVLVLSAASGDVVGRGQHAYGLVPDLLPGHAEQHPDTWIDAVQVAARQALAAVDRARIAGVGVSGQQHGCVVLDADDRVVRPAKLWCDTSTATEAARLSQQLGRAVPTGFTASKLAWLAAHEPRHWARVARVLLPHDYVNLRLTGRATMECGDASGTGWFEPRTRAFDGRAMAAIDPRLSAMLPPLLAAGEPAGALSPAGAALLGLRPGIPVAAGGGDNMMAAIGCGATRAGIAVVSLGTSGTVFARSEVPVVDPLGAIAPFCSSDGAWLPLLCTMNVTGVTEAVAQWTGRDHAALTAAAAQVAVGGDGLLWLPFLQGERVPDLPTATGTLLGMRATNLSPGHLYRAAIEGTSCTLALGARRFADLAVPFREVRLCGGGSRNALWRQVLADLLAVSVTTMAEPEAAALGAAIQAAWTVRRLRGERVDCDAVAQPFVRTTGARCEPSAAAGRYGEVLQRFAAEVGRLYGNGR